MRKLHLIICLISIYFLSSCAIFRSDKFIDGQIAVTKENMHLLDGNYQRFSIAKTNGKSEDLFLQIANKGNDLTNDSLWYVRFKVIDDRHIEASLLHKVGSLKQKTYRGKLRHGYYELNRRYLIIPALFVNLFRSTKFRLGVMENGDITTDHKNVSWGTGYFIIPFFDQDKSFDNQFEKIQ